MTFGDVLAIALMIVVTIVTLWAGIVAFAVLFSGKARVAADALSAKPGKQIGVGLAIAVVTGVIAVSILPKNGPLAMIGIVMLAMVFALAVLGSAGLTLVVADRLRSFDAKVTGVEARHGDTSFSPLVAVARGAGLCMAAGLIPVIGWFFLFPAAVFASLGAGFTALIHRKRAVPEPIAIAVPAES